MVPRWSTRSVVVHPDAGIADGELVLLLIQFQIDARLEDQGLVRLLGQESGT